MVVAMLVRAIRAADRRSGIFAPHGSRAYAAVAPRVLRGFYRRVAADAAEFVGRRQSAVGVIVVDLGSGPGHLVRELRRRLPGARVVGIEPFDEMRRLAVARGGEFLDGAAEAIPLDDRSVDLVVSTLSAHHWLDMTAAFRELDRVLRPGGEAWIYDLRFAAYGPEDVLGIAVAAGLDPTHVTRRVMPGRFVRPFALIRLTG
jgi:ubiquinone/menaquinone biosynthesis C-methylase UbiE